MQLEHSFTVPAGIDDAWHVLLDIERVAPCLPGAALDTVDGDNFTGTVKVKLGPINLTYKGKASFVEKDETSHRAVINAQGRDTRGNGTAAAKVTATLRDQAGQTKVDVVTDLDITGKPAQFGRGVMADVGNKLVGQFADCLAGKLSGGDGASGRAAPDSPTIPVAVGDSGTAADPASDTASLRVERAVPPESVPAEAAQPAAPQSAPAAAAAPGAAAAAQPAPAPASPRPAQPAEVEPINLLESAGPAVLKRVAPLAAVLLAVLFVILRRHAR